MQTQYTAIAQYYDRLNGADYDAWCDFLLSCLATYGKVSRGLPPECEVLDLACGTGAIALRLAARGYDVVGVDLSAEMLTVARERAQTQGQDVLWLQQDMRAFELYGTVEAAFCCLDSLNYLLTRDDWEKTFSLLHNYIEPHGLLIFDVHTKDCLQALGAQDIVCEDDGVLLTWQSEYHEKTACCDFYLSFFCEDKDGRYTRTEEHQRQRAFSDRTIRDMLKKNGFTVLHTCADLLGTPPAQGDERCFYVCRCEK